MNEENDYVIGVVFPPEEQPYVTCTCGFEEGVTNEAEAESVKLWHIKHHEESRLE